MSAFGYRNGLFSGQSDTGSRILAYLKKNRRKKSQNEATHHDHVEQNYVINLGRLCDNIYKYIRIHNYQFKY